MFRDDGRVTIPVDLAECKVELLGGRHSATLERWVLAMCEEIDLLRRSGAMYCEQIRELERAQFVGKE